MDNNPEKRKKFNVRKSTTDLAVMGILTALCIVIAMFLTIRPSSSIKITLTFIPIVIAAYLYGPAGAGTVAGLADILGYVFNSGGGMLFLPITFSEITVGIIFGLLLHNKRTMPRIILGVAFAQLVVSTFVTPIWLNMLYGMDYLTNIYLRIPQILIMTAIEMIVIPPMLKLLEKLRSAKVIE